MKAVWSAQLITAFISTQWVTILFLQELYQTISSVFTALHAALYPWEGCPFARPSVYHTRDLWQNERKFCPDFYTVTTSFPPSLLFPYNWKLTTRWVKQNIYLDRKYEQNTYSNAMQSVNTARAENITVCGIIRPKGMVKRWGTRGEELKRS